MWQRFTERARRVVFFAQEEAGKLGESTVGTEHLLLGLMRDSDSLAMRVLDNMGISSNMIRSEAAKRVKKREGKLGHDMQLSQRSKRVIDLAYDEARALMNNYIGTEHLLLGLVRESEGIAAQILSDAGAEITKMRAVIVSLQDSKKDSGKSPDGVAFWKGEKAPDMKGKDLLEIGCMSKVEIEAVFDTTHILKDSATPERQRSILAGKTLAMIFEKQSLRTRVSFETGIFQLGGHGIYLAPADISLGKRESIADVAHNLERMCDIIMARVFSHDTVTELAKHSRVPVINGLSDLEHPCQALADFYTIKEKKGRFEGLKLVFVGDGNNVAHSLMLLAAKVGTHFTLACPEGYDPMEKVLAEARAFARDTGAKIEIERDPIVAANNADIIYTDVWASMGQEAEAEERAKVFAPYQVNAELMAHAKPDAIFMHCLPAHRGSEVTDEVIDSPQSVVFDEAENRLHAQKAVMALVAG